MAEMGAAYSPSPTITLPPLKPKAVSYSGRTKCSTAKVQGQGQNANVTMRKIVVSPSKTTR